MKSANYRDEHVDVKISTEAMKRLDRDFADIFDVTAKEVQPVPSLPSPDKEI